MKAELRRAFFAFTRESREPPYVDTRFTGITVLPVQAKAIFGLARSRRRIHRMTAVASICHGGEVAYAARFLCGESTWHAVLVPERALGVPCALCVDALMPNIVYRCFDHAGCLLYIGSTTGRQVRMYQHKSTSPWWDEVADLRIERYPTLDEARAAEQAAIAAENPIYNIQHKRQQAA